jgi:hypothetical protein
LLPTVFTPIIEGDERYTKIGKQVPAEASAGWTVVPRDRARRLIGAWAGGKREKKLLLSAIPTLKEILVRTGDRTFLTDSERRDRLLLVEMGQEW